MAKMTNLEWLEKRENLDKYVLPEDFYEIVNKHKVTITKDCIEIDTDWKKVKIIRKVNRIKQIDNAIKKLQEEKDSLQGGE